MTDFAGRHVAITGASSGIGRAAAILLAKRGASISLIARRKEALDSVYRAAGDVVFAAPADVADPAAMGAAFDAAEARFGPIDGLFANAGTGGSFAPLADYDDDVFEAVVATNLTAVFRAIKRVQPQMVARRRGAIVVTGSLASERGMANNAGYVASKHGVLGLARAVALESAPHNVRVNCVIPGFIDTPMLADLGEDVRATLAAATPQGRLGGAEEVAETAAFLLSDAASHITAQAIAIDGGILGTLAPD